MDALYKDVDIGIPQSKILSTNVRSLPIFRTDVVRLMKRLTIRNGNIDRRDPVHNITRRCSDTRSVEAYVCDIVNRIPLNHLESFSYAAIL
jgi:hypothetical protein